MKPAYIAKDDKTGDILALGEAARSMVGRTPKRHICYSPCSSRCYCRL